ncbi:MAG: hypothetical protein RMJ82_06035, partial [Gemmatales bacterium]|nr:hypothetical protein [Gemmatales bacterium]
MPEQRRARLSIEQLEDRCIPTGNVALSLFNPDLASPGEETVYIVGDDLANEIIVAVLPLSQGAYSAPPYFTNVNFTGGRWLFVFDGDGTTRITGGTQGDGVTWAATVIQDAATINASRIVLNLAQGSDTVEINYFDSRAATLGGGGGGGGGG